MKWNEMKCKEVWFWKDEWEYIPISEGGSNVSISILSMLAFDWGFYTSRITLVLCKLYIYSQKIIPLRMRHFLEYCVARDGFLLLIRRLRRSCRFITSIEPIGAFIWRFAVWATRSITLQHITPLFPSRRLAPTVIRRVQIGSVVISHCNRLP